MLEFFAVTALAEHMKNKKEKEDERMKEYFHQTGEGNIKYVITEQTTNTSAMNLVLGVVALFISLYTARLAYNCNQKSDAVVRILAMLFGFFFSGLYLLYYFVRYLLMGQKC